MAVKKLPPQLVIRSDADGVKPAWAPIYCHVHHFENLEQGKSCGKIVGYDPATGKLQWKGCRPHPQTRALLADPDILLIGGSRGGTKSETMRRFMVKGNPLDPQDHPIRGDKPYHPTVRVDGIEFCPICVNISYAMHPWYRGLVLRENEKDLSDFIERCAEAWAPFGVKMRQSPKEAEFPSGALIRFAHLKDESAFTDVQGHEYTRLAANELTQIPASMQDPTRSDRFEKVRMSVRNKWGCRQGCAVGTCRCGALRPQVITDANPGGVGHGWVKKYFSISDRPSHNLKVWYDQKGREGKLVRLSRMFIPMKAEENPYISDEYLAGLDALPEPLRSMWRDGDWDALAGQVFPDFRARKIVGEPDEAMHVVEPGSVAVQGWWQRIGALDWGFQHHSVLLRAVATPQGRVIVRGELAVQHLGSVELGEAIAKTFIPDLVEMKLAGVEPVVTLYCSPDAWQVRDNQRATVDLIAAGAAKVLGPGAVAIGDRLYTGDGKVEWEALNYQESAQLVIRRAENDRIAGVQHMREMLRWRKLNLPEHKIDPVELAKLYIESHTLAERYNEAVKRSKPETLPKLLIESTCRGLIESIPVLVYDQDAANRSNPTRREDVLKTEELSDDFYDAVRYLVFSHHVSESRPPKHAWIAERAAATLQASGRTDFNARLWASRHAEAEYAKDEEMAGAFSVPASSFQRMMRQ